MELFLLIHKDPSNQLHIVQCGGMCIVARDIAEKSKKCMKQHWPSSKFYIIQCPKELLK